jgi:hypothetical protein
MEQSYNEVPVLFLETKTWLPVKPQFISEF